MNRTFRKYIHDLAIMGCTIIFIATAYLVVTAPADGSRAGFTAFAFVWAIAAAIASIVLLARREEDSLGKRIALLLIKWS